MSKVERRNNGGEGKWRKETSCEKGRRGEGNEGKREMEGRKEREREMEEREVNMR